MRLAIISDIHSNLEALDRTLAFIKSEAIDEVICLGDLVGYGASPNECIELIRGVTAHILLGNHDEAVVDLTKTEHFNPFARIAAEWTHDQITAEHRDFLCALPYTIERHGALFVHSSPREPQEWHYILSPADAQMNFAAFTQSICFVGHSHVPEIYCEDIWTREVVTGKRFIVNVGSVGQPRDLNWQASLGILDTDQWTYRNIRLDYDVKKAAEKIHKAGLPKTLGDRLLVGR